jgi:Family of unknown function (DUF5670)
MICANRLKAELQTIFGGANKMLTVVAILLLLWLYGLTIGLFGNMIHLLLIVALVALVFYAAANR